MIPTTSKAAFRSMIEGLWCQALEKMPLWHLIDNDRRITNEVPELQYFCAKPCSRWPRIWQAISATGCG